MHTVNWIPFRTPVRDNIFNDGTKEKNRWWNCNAMNNTLAHLTLAWFGSTFVYFCNSRSGWRERARTPNVFFFFHRLVVVSLFLIYLLFLCKLLFEELIYHLQKFLTIWKISSVLIWFHVIIFLLLFFTLSQILITNTCWYN